MIKYLNFTTKGGLIKKNKLLNLVVYFSFKKWYNVKGDFMAIIYDFKEKIDIDKLQNVANGIRNSKIAIFPTETVYGIGANALDEAAVNKIFQAKGRPSDNPLIVHLADKNMIDLVARDISYVEQVLIDNFMPGPITIILKKKDVVPLIVTGGLDTVGVRIPENNIAQQLITLAQVPIAAPSANISGKPSGTNIDDIKEELFDRVDYIIDGGNCSIGIESTVVKLENDFVKILRPGKITKEDIEQLGLKVVIDKHIFSKVKDTEKVESPGMKHRHYAPNAKAVLVEGNNKEKINMINKLIVENVDKYSNICIVGFEEHKVFFKEYNFISFGSINDLNTVSKNIFKVLRNLDNQKCDFCIIEGVEKKGIGVGISNRLLRACEYNVVEV